MSAPPKFSDVSAEIVEALAAEIDHRRKKPSGAATAITGGRYQGVVGGKHSYVFTAGELSHIPDDTPVSVVIKGEAADGVVIAREGQQVTVALNQFIGRDVTEAKLVSDPIHLLDSLRKKFAEFVPRARHLNPSLVESLLHARFAKRERGALPEGLEKGGDSPKKFNPSQIEAVAHGLGSTAAFIWGPPGTGKTQTLALAATSLVVQGKGVLVVGHTNVSVDNAIEAILSRFGAQSRLRAAYEDGKIIRFGVPKSKSLGETWPNVLVENIIEKKGAELRRRQGELEEDERTLVGASRACASRLSLCDELDTFVEQKKSIEKALRQLATSVQKQVEMEVKLAAKITILVGRLEAARSAGRLSRLIRGLNPIAIESQLQKDSNEHERVRVDIARLEGESKAGEMSQVELESKLKGIAGRLDGHDREGLLRTKASLEAKLITARKEWQEVKAQLERLAAQVLSEALIIGATMTKAATESVLHSRTYSAVLVDEASMAPVPLLLFSALLAQERILVFGDHMQLPPIAASDDHRVLKWLKDDIYGRSGIRDALEGEGGSAPAVSMLDIQYRMHPHVSEFCSHHFYGGRLKNGGELEVQLAPIVSRSPGSGKSLVLVDTSQTHNWCARTSEFSRFNLYSACTSLAIVEELLKQGVEDIGIISPYSAQARLIRKLLAGHDWPNSVEASTIHQFQGREKAVMILDLVDGPPFPPGKLVDDPNSGGIDERLLNVAVSRARGKFILVCDKEYVRIRHSASSLIPKLLQAIEDVGDIVDGRDYIPQFDVDDAIDVAMPISSLEPGDSLHTQASFYSAFTADVMKAKETLVILSPFVTAQRLGQILPVLQSVVDRGVKVALVTDLVQYQPAIKVEACEALQAEVKKHGIFWVERRKMHEKIAFIDGRVVWYGSLNILSQRSTTETMMRWESEEVSKQMSQFLGLMSIFTTPDGGGASRGAKRPAPVNIICPKCGAAMLIKDGKYGQFYGCSRYPKCSGILKISQVDIQAAAQRTGAVPVCPDHGVEMVLRFNPKNKQKFWGCPKYPNCRKTQAARV